MAHEFARKKFPHLFRDNGDDTPFLSDPPHPSTLDPMTRNDNFQHEMDRVRNALNYQAQTRTAMQMGARRIIEHEGIFYNYQTGEQIFWTMHPYYNLTYSQKQAMTICYDLRMKQEYSLQLPCSTMEEPHPEELYIWDHVPNIIIVDNIIYDVRTGRQYDYQRLESDNITEAQRTMLQLAAERQQQHQQQEHTLMNMGTTVARLSASSTSSKTVVTPMESISEASTTTPASNDTSTTSSALDFNTIDASSPPTLTSTPILSPVPRLTDQTSLQAPSYPTMNTTPITTATGTTTASSSPDQTLQLHARDETPTFEDLEEDDKLPSQFLFL